MMMTTTDTVQYNMYMYFIFKIRANKIVFFFFFGVQSFLTFRLLLFNRLNSSQKYSILFYDIRPNNDVGHVLS